MIKSKEATINVSGLTAATFDRRYPFCAIRNDSSNPVYVSTANDKCISGMDGVVAVAAGGSFVIENGIADTKTTTVFFRGNGPVTVIGQYDSNNRFKIQLKGGETKEITPESLGYVSGAKLFFDGYYNYVSKHADNGVAWVDMVGCNVMNRNSANSYADLIGTDHYIKQSGAASALHIPDKLEYDNFTAELFAEITGGNTDENDILANFQSSGFGILTEKGKIKACMYAQSSYHYTEGFTYSQNTKYLMTITYNGQTLSQYVNGELVETLDIPLENYKKPVVDTYLGSSGSGGDAYGTYNFYRFAIYDKALTVAEVMANYNTDVLRF
nr:MAG TPA: Concanavalin A-like lectin/glucanase superfamily protein [Caudoviricetes sp.]